MVLSEDKYNPAVIEPRWAQAWSHAQTFAAEPAALDAAAPSKSKADLGDTSCDSDKPFYVLEMFPYPSGSLHMGHVRNYTIGDVFARFYRMQGRQVLHPMGWDALGLPAENQAIAEGVAPQVRTPKNIAQMKEQLTRLGLAYDWSREFATCDSSYYRWNQWFFLQFLKKDWVYRRQATVNWCPGCNTILANEQVRDDATCWRGHAGVSQRQVPEWAFRITHFADDLLAGLKTLQDSWPTRITRQQHHWIGRSEGTKVQFRVAQSETSPDEAPTTLEVFTTRIDTLYGCTFVVLAPNHPEVARLCPAENQEAVAAFAREIAKQEPASRTDDKAAPQGVPLGRDVIHPITGAKLPIWLGSFVLADYGTGAVLAVPAHDHRDFRFAKHYDLPITQVIQDPSEDGAQASSPTAAFAGDGILINSKEHTGLTSADARAQLAALAQEQGFGGPTVQWHLRDWGFSRQRYWGTPIPIIYCKTHGAQPVPEADLPVMLPAFEDVSLTGTDGAPLAKLESFVATICPVCNGPAQRETETMDTFVDSAWYFARFLSPHDTTQAVDPKLAKKWLPVDVYVGGPEHAVMHLLYFRFWTRAMKALGLVDIDEPAKRLITQGMVNARAFRCPTHGYVAAKEVQDLPQDKQICPQCEAPLQSAIVKMSKSKFNGIDPMAIIERYGADTARLYTLFAAPPQKDLDWNPDGVEGVYRFVLRVYRLLAMQSMRAAPATPASSMEGCQDPDRKVRQAVHRTLQKVAGEIQERTHFNTAIAAMMTLCNTLYEHGLHEENCSVAAPVVKEALQIFAQMLAPFAPFLAEEMWHKLGHTSWIGQSRWPKVDAHALLADSMIIPVQVNGKRRGQIDVAVDTDQASIVAMAKGDPNVAKFLDQKDIVREIYVPKRLLNFVVRS